MAQEIIIGASLKVVKAKLSQELGRFGQTIDWSGTRYIHQIQQLAAASVYETLTLWDVAATWATAGWAIFINHDTTASKYITLSNTTAAAGAFARLAAGECFVVRLSLSTLYAAWDGASGNTANLEYLILEN